MTPDPFIRDAAFRGSPILSYGTVNPGRVWPKFLALAAGIFVLLVLMVFSWFWFFTKIPIPSDSVVFTVLPASASLNTNSPLVWKQSQVLNSPLPTIAGLVKSTPSYSTDKSLGYAIRLSPATAIIGKTRLWDLVSDEQLRVGSFRSPYEVFGWPWEMFNGEMQLTVKVRDLFSSPELSWDGLLDEIDGVVIGNKWKTNLPVQEKAQEQAMPDNDVSGFVRLDGGQQDILKNFLQYYGAWADITEPWYLTWKFDPSLVAIDYKDLEAADSAIGFIDDEEVKLISMPYTLPDGYIAERKYISPTTTNNIVFTSSTSLEIEVEQSGMGINTSSVSSLTCDGDILARFDHQSLQNFCSWIDICYFDFNNVVLLNEGGYLTACGY